MSNRYNQPCQWSTDNRTLRDIWTILFNPSHDYLKHCGLANAATAHSEVTAEVAALLELHGGEGQVASVLMLCVAGTRAASLHCCAFHLCSSKALYEGQLYLQKTRQQGLWMPGVCWLWACFWWWWWCWDFRPNVKNVYEWADSGTYSDTLWTKSPHWALMEKVKWIEWSILT